MPALQILTNLDTDRPPLVLAQLAEAECVTIGRLPAGMQSGQSSVAVYAKLREPFILADGRTITHVFCETSLALFSAANAAFDGAERRDEDERRRHICNG